MCELIIIGFNLNDLTSSFDNYLKYKFYWRNKKYIYKTLSKSLLDFDINTIKDTKLTIENIFGKTELSQVIRELFDYAKNNCGSGVKEYHVSKSKKEGSVIFCIITLEDIMKFKKGASNMSETLKNDIINNKFDNLWINCKESDIL